MNRSTLVLLLLFTLIMTACSGNASNAAGPAAGTQSGPAAGELSAGAQVALGTVKLEGTENAVTAEQAAELLPLWQTLEVLYGSDMAATQEIDALIAQIQETMTPEQTQAIAALNLTRQDMMTVMQEQGMAMGGGNANAQSGNSTTNNGSGFRPGGGEMPGGMPPGGGGFPGGGPGFQEQGSRTQSTDSGTASSPAAIDPNRVPTPLVSAVIQYLKEKIGS